MSKTIEISVYDLQEFEREAIENKELREENRKLKSDLATVIDERDNAFNKIKQLEERLDNKEKLNEEYRKEIDTLESDLIIYKNQYGVLTD